MISGDKGGPYAATGGSSSISANRISYVLGLKGPCPWLSLLGSLLPPEGAPLLGCPERHLDTP